MNKDEKLQNTKYRLIESTLVLMEDMDDPLTVTSRQIAAKAGVKPGMINYCFGSRENLIYQTFQTQYIAFLKDSDVSSIINSQASPKQIIKQLHFIVARCLVDNYKFTKAITGFVLFKRDLGKESFTYPYVLKHYEGKKSEAECRLIAYELSTMMQLILYRKDDIKKDFGIDLADKEELKRFLDMRIDLLLGD